MPINAHLAVKGRDGIARESALVTEVFTLIDHLYYTGVFTPKQAEGFTKRLMKVKTVAGLTKLAKDVKAMEDAVLYRNPHRRNGVTGLTASVEQDDLSGGWAVYLHAGRRSLNMTDDYFATKAAAQREAKAMLAQARAGIPLDAIAQGFYEAHHKAARRASHPLANRRRRVTRRRTARRNPTYGIPPYVVPQDAKKGDRVAEVQELRHGGVEVIFGTASTDWDGRFELRVAWGKSSKVYKTAAGAEKAVAKWLTTGK
jgi:hypothetical protein